MPENNKTILAQANAAITSGNYEEFLSFCTEDTKWTLVGEQTLRGKEAVRNWMATAYKQPPTFRVERLIAEDEFVTALGRIMLPAEADELVEHAYCDVWRFRDGKMAALQAFVLKP